MIHLLLLGFIQTFYISSVNKSIGLCALWYELHLYSTVRLHALCVRALETTLKLEMRM